MDPLFKLDFKPYYNAEFGVQVDTEEQEQKITSAKKSSISQINRQLDYLEQSRKNNPKTAEDAEFKFLFAVFTKCKEKWDSLTFWQKCVAYFRNWQESISQAFASAGEQAKTAQVMTRSGPPQLNWLESMMARGDAIRAVQEAEARGQYLSHTKAHADAILTYQILNGDR